MGLMEQPQAIITPHPVTLEGQRIGVELVPGETLAEFLARAVPEEMACGWEVRINGRIVPHELMPRVRPKPGTVIEVRGIVRRQALMIVAMAALTYFTMGAGATWAAGLGAVGSTAVYAAAFVAGSILINKVLGPRPPRNDQREPDTVHSLAGARNRMRPYEPLPLVFGTVRTAPDIISAPYMWYEGDDQYLGMVLTPGINAHRVEALHNGDTPLSSYEGVSVYQNGFPGMASQPIPLYSDADSIQGGELENTAAWVERTTPANTVRIQINLEYILGDMTAKGRDLNNHETVQVEYRPVGGGSWSTLANRSLVNNNYDTKRLTLSFNVASGQYDVRVRRLGQAIEFERGRAQFQWTTMTAVQADAATYAGIPRTGVAIKATGQLNGTPDELRYVVYSRPVPVWDGTAWVTEETSNPGAQILAYVRGIEDENGERIAGMGLPEEMIDVPGLQAFMLHCAANGYEYNNVVREVRSHDDMLNALAMAGFGHITWSGGRLSVAWADSEQPVSGVVNMATIKRGQFQVDYTLANAADGVELTYYDSTDWSTKTLRVPAPGVAVMLNPASITAEGVTSEAHAARLARWHLAQSLYQYKDISYSTDIEHLSYRRMSLLSLQHDLTQWGHGGRLVAAELDGGVVLTLDEPVPPGPTRYIGVRIPGERVYRVFQVQAFSEPTDTITLVGTWPGDAAFPGDSPGNPAHDYLWCYDFKSTPGLRARVVSIEPESDLKGARVAVVPESPEFWDYVETGHYVPPAVTPPRLNRPIASNLAVTERRVVQGDTVFTELVATFDIDGPVSHSVILMSDANGIMREVAQTATRTASWRIEEPGVYTVAVRPFSPDGHAGIAMSIVYATEGVDVPPVLVDLFDVVERSGGIRQYTWGWLAGTTQSPDFAGVEIRYLEGTHASPDWDDMTPLGTDGYFTAPLEHTLPEEGTWTFACRSRNTSGTLSTGMRVITRTIGANLGERIDGIDQDLIDQQTAIDQAAADALEAKLEAASVAALAGTPWDDDTAWQTGDVVYHDGRMYRALQSSTDVEPPNAAYWADIGTITEAQSETAQAIRQLITDVDGNAQAITQVSQDLGDTQASVTTLAEVQGSMQGISIVTNPSFEDGGSGWAFLLSSDGVVIGPWANARTGGNVLTFNSGRIEDRVVRNNGRTPVVTGEQVRFGAWVRYSGSGGSIGSARIRIILRWWQASGSGHSVDTITISGNDLSTTWRKFDAVRAAPAGAVTANVEFWVDNHESGSGTIRIDDAFLEPLSGEESSMRARHTVALDVNGYISGTVSENDGERSVFSIMATVFRVISSGTVGMEWQDGYLRAYAGSIQLLFGINFGASSDLCFWYGPNVGANNCTKANGTIWFDNTGSAYFGGSLSAGVRKNGAQTTQLSTTASVETGNFGSAGNPRVLVASFSFTKSYPGTGGGSYTATLQLRRGTTVLASTPVTVTYTAAGGVVSGSGSASITHTDSTAGSTFNYNARLVSPSGDWVAHGGNPSSGSQTVSILSTEE